MSKFNVPSHLNGYPVVCKAESQNCVTVMVERKDIPELPFVVATWWPELGQSWSWGHYVGNDMKYRVFNEVAEHNNKR